jgi:hypothetical protein
MYVYIEMYMGICSSPWQLAYVTRVFQARLRRVRIPLGSQVAVV